MRQNVFFKLVTCWDALQHLEQHWRQKLRLCHPPPAGSKLFFPSSGFFSKAEVDSLFMLQSCGEGGEMYAAEVSTGGNLTLRTFSHQNWGCMLTAGEAALRETREKWWQSTSLRHSNPKLDLKNCCTIRCNQDARVSFRSQQGRNPGVGKHYDLWATKGRGVECLGNPPYKRKK